MCGPIGGCGGGAALAARASSGGGAAAPGHGHGTTSGRGSTAASTHAGGHDAAAGAALVGQARSAWGSSTTFAVSAATPSEHGGHMATKLTITRTSANDMRLANRVMEAATKLLQPLQWNQTSGKENPNSDHRMIPASVKAQWAQQYPDLPVPNLVVFDKQSQRPVGALFVGGEQAKDLGMGTMHEHDAGGAIMQHMWFIPNDMELAFSDVTNKQQAIQAALGR